MPKGSAPYAGMTLTAGELGQLLGLSERRCREMRDQGVIPCDERGRFILPDAVVAYCAHMRPATGKAAAGGSEGGQSLDEARIRLLTAQADAREMLNTQMRGETVLAEDLEVVAGSIVDGFRAKVLALPTRAAPLVVGLQGLAEVRDKLTELMYEACGDLAAIEIVSAVSDRAARRAGRSVDGDADLQADGAPAKAHDKPVG